MNNNFKHKLLLQKHQNGSKLKSIYDYITGSNKNKIQYSDSEEFKSEEEVAKFLGLTNNNDLIGNSYCYKKDGKEIIQCAKYANIVSTKLGHKTTGDAWTRQGQNGTKVLLGSTPSSNTAKGRYDLLFMNYKRANKINLDNTKFRNGDIVDLYSLFSDYNNQARQKGRGNSHTGTIVIINDEPHVTHNIHGKITIEPLKKFWGYFPGRYSITRISRPK